MSNRKFIVVLSWIMAIFIIAGCITAGIAFDKKNNYVNSEYSSYSTNAYVGGDAYNYIINGTYFIGYLIISMSCYLMALVSLIAIFYFESLEKRRVIDTPIHQRTIETNDLPPI